MKRIILCGVLTSTIGSFLAVPAFGAPTGETKEFVYKKAPQGELKIYIHYPPGWKASDKRPAIIFFFGGGWTKGTSDQFLPQAEYLARRGLVTARADYRVASRQHTTPTDAVEDARSAVRWYRQHAAELGIDPDKIIASGGSAGGHLAACTAFVPGPDAKGEDTSISCKPCALVLYNPVVDFAAMAEGGGKGENTRLTKDISPAEFLKSGAPPTVMFFGTSDRLLAQARSFMAKSRKLGNSVELFLADKQGHGFFNRPPWQDVTLRKTDEYLTTLGYLSGPPTLQIPADTAAVLKEEK